MRFGTDVSNEMLLNAVKCQGYNFYCLWDIKGKPTEVKLPPPPSTRLWLKRVRERGLQRVLEREKFRKKDT